MTTKSYVFLQGTIKVNVFDQKQKEEKIMSSAAASVAAEVL